VAKDFRSGKSAPRNEILINANAGETRVAILEQGHFSELYIERETDRSVTGTVALGRVNRVLPGMQAAFVDIGLEKAAFLYVGDYLDESDALAELDAEEEPRPRRRGRNGRNGGRPQPKIDALLSEGQEIVVQVAKDPIGTKGARITSHVSIAGRHLVLTPWSQRVGVSRRIDSDRERRRLRDAVSRIRPKDLGFIIRTAGEGTREADLEADVRYLTSVWDEIQVRKKEVRAPAALHSELSLPIRVIRDFAGPRTKRIVVDDDAVYQEMESFLSRFVADPKPTLTHYQGSLPIFDHFDIESQIDTSLGKKVWLKSGGYLIVDQSEALTAIDVNTGRYVGKQNLEETVLKTNLEAVKEVVNQLRFRNIGGLIIIDLIDMESTENREKVYRALQDALRVDKAKTNILKISELGLVEMTRKRTRENLVQQLCEPCLYCEGRGYVLSAESVAYKALREIRKDLPLFCGRRIAVTVSPQVAEMLLGPARKAVAALREELGREIEIRARTGQHQEQFEVTALDAGPPVSLELPWLAELRPKKSPEAPEPEADEAGESAPEEAEASLQEPLPGAGEQGPSEPTPEPPAAASEPAVAPAGPVLLAPGAEQPASAAEPPEGKPEPPEAPAAAAPREPAAELVLAAETGAPAAPEVLDADEENPILRRSESLEDS
jgi:ribonuclease G